jgi:FAD:protein FMN transferase
MGAPSEIHRFNHQAMNTDFTLSIADSKPKYAAQAAVNAFREIDRVEGFLSSHIENSDISRINNLPSDGSTMIDPLSFECLRIAEQMRQATGGAFNVAYASKPSRPVKRLFSLEADKFVCRVNDAGLRIDLGGIGKGFALDCVAELLRDWDLTAIEIRASYSTVLAGQAPRGRAGWEAGFGAGHDQHDFMLAQQALSGSGIAVQGEHIVDPRPRKGRHVFRAWALSRSAARADALSTALMIMSPDEIRRYAEEHPIDRVWVQELEDARIVEIAAPTQ